MSTRKKPGNLVQHLFRKLRQLLNALTKACFNWILRSLLKLQRRSRLSQAGFVLPTVVMVVLVVILLTTAIMFRSFDRSKNASNYRVDEVVLKAATPAIDRARAKITQLFSAKETGLTTNPPSEDDLARVFSQSKYTFGDETQLKVVYDYLKANGDAGGDGTINNEKETLQTAWKFPVDTDNDGKFDSYTLYGIYFRNPKSNEDRPRSPIEARALPQEEGASSGCGSSNAGTKVEGWYLTSGKLKKAFFTYVANVPITTLGTLNPNQYEVYKGNKGFSALEMQLDQAQTSLDNNAVWYEDDLEISNVPDFRLNGRIHTNSNLMVGNTSNGGGTINFRQVSARASCFYTADNAKIVVGGNVSAGTLAAINGSTRDVSNDLVKVDLFDGRNGAGQTPPQKVIREDNTTTTLDPPQVASNSDAYYQRLNVLVQGALNLFDQANPNFVTNPLPAVTNFTRFPQEIRDRFEEKYDPDDNASARQSLEQVVKTYFAERVRRVSYVEVPADQPELALQAGGANQLSATPNSSDFVFAGGGELTAPMEWMLIGTNNQGDAGSVAAYSKVPLRINNDKMELETNKPPAPNALIQKEDDIGDRVLVGNALPTRWVNDATTNPITYADEGAEQDIPGVNWNDGGQRYRIARAQQLDDLGDTSRSGFWEQAAALTGNPAKNYGDIAGGVRVITGAGIYIDDRPLIAQGTGRRGTDSFLPPPPSDDEVLNKVIVLNDLKPAEIVALKSNLPNKKLRVVWPDSMPMNQWNDKFARGTRNKIEQKKGDLQMRATVVYHYAPSEGADQEPIACISSYYDPTDAKTAKNLSSLPFNSDPEGFSNNGINYTYQGLKTRRQPTDRLRRQANMVFPDGRWANKPLRDAIAHFDQSGKDGLTLADNAAFDAANCALDILNPKAVPADNPLIPDGAIQEKAFLDARQVKTLHKPQAVDAATGNPIPDPGTSLADIGNLDQVKIAELVDLKKLQEVTTKTGKGPARLTVSDVKTLTDEYSLPIEQRQPLEVRVTEIDLGQLKASSVEASTTGGGVNDNEEFMIPNSGIIYASRDDAMPDISSPTSPATDFQLDPTRRVRGIRLVNGRDLSRKPEFRTAEKGLILASDLPVYIKDDFNLHLSGGSEVQEFTTALNATNFYTRTGRNDNFACRINQNDDCTAGDQWRSARILADSVTLLSKNFRDGYRSEGDYDFNNNAGNTAVETRLKNGFWWNSFATSAKWYDTTSGEPLADFDAEAGNQPGSSYVTNGVTPVQRRINFPVYKMEICRKLPVSLCGPTDWVADAPGAGNTATDLSTLPAQLKANQFFPRRVVFVRDKFGQLELDGKGFAQPKVPNGLLNSNPLPYGSPVPPGQPNALWFATSKFDDQPFDPAVQTSLYDFGSDPSKPLYYLPPEPEVPIAGVAHERQLLLPGTPTFPDSIPNAAAINALNGQTAQDPSDFAVCMQGGYSPDPTNPTTVTDVEALKPGPCPALAKIQQARTALAALPATGTELFTPTTAPILTADRQVNVYELPANGTLQDLKITLKSGNQSNPIFVFRMPASANKPIIFGGTTTQGIEVEPEGVDPNNIFWVSNAGIQFGNLPHQLVGNFIGSGLLRIDGNPNQSKILGGRFLGFSQLRTGGTGLGKNPNIRFGTVKNAFPAGFLQALRTTDQPLLIPILQLHAPTGTTVGQGSKLEQTRWIPEATETTFNAAFVMRDAPSRPLPASPEKGESGGGLQNFPRFLENWKQSIPATIRGSFIQLGRSAIATAPFEAIDNANRDNSLFFDTDAYAQGLSIGGYRYPGGAQQQKAPYYNPPTRDWGYDVGFLSQTPDLFSRRFASPSPGTPSEFYREASRDDNWVAGLMCAAEKQAPSSTAYQWAIPDPKQRPTSCPDLADYSFGD
jgi:type II secretory pathway pseudopilin PulG